MSYRQIWVVFTKILNLNSFWHTAERSTLCSMHAPPLFLEQLIINCGLKIIHAHVCSAVGLGWLIWPLLWNLTNKIFVSWHQQGPVGRNTSQGLNGLIGTCFFIGGGFVHVHDWFFYFLSFYPNQAQSSLSDNMRSKWQWLEPLSTHYAECVLENTLKMWIFHM